MAHCSDYVKIVDNTGIEKGDLVENLKFDQKFEITIVHKYFNYHKFQFPKHIKDDSILPKKKRSPSLFKNYDLNDLILKRRGYETVSNINRGLKTIKVAFCNKRNCQVIVKIMPTYITKLLHNNKVKKVYITRNCIREINHLRKINHENILRIYGHFRADQKLFLIVQYGPYGTLFDSIRQFSYFEENMAREIFKGLLSAVHYCHKKKIYLRNITCENIYLFDNLEVKLSIAHMNKNFYNFYKPPPHQKKTLRPCSNIVGSMGLVLYVILVGYFPDRFYSCRKCNWISVYFDLVPAFPILTGTVIDLLHRMFASHCIAMSIDDLVHNPWITAETHYLKETALQYEYRLHLELLEYFDKRQEQLRAENARARLISRLLVNEHRQLIKGLIRKLKNEKVQMDEDPVDLLSI